MQMQSFVVAVFRFVEGRRGKRRKIKKETATDLNAILASRKFCGDLDDAKVFEPRWKMSQSMFELKASKFARRPIV